MHQLHHPHIQAFPELGHPVHGAHRECQRSGAVNGSHSHRACWSRNPMCSSCSQRCEIAIGLDEGRVPCSGLRTDDDGTCRKQCAHPVGEDSKQAVAPCVGKAESLAIFGRGRSVGHPLLGGCNAGLWQNGYAVYRLDCRNVGSNEIIVCSGRQGAGGTRSEEGALRSVPYAKCKAAAAGASAVAALCAAGIGAIQGSTPRCWGVDIVEIHECPVLHGDNCRAGQWQHQDAEQATNRQEGHILDFSLTSNVLPVTSILCGAWPCCLIWLGNNVIYACP